MQERIMRSVMPDTVPQGPVFRRRVSDRPAFERLIARFVSLWNYPFLDYGAVRVGLLVALASLCLVRAYIGLSGIAVYSHDAFGTLDGAWRLLHGQTPHADFYTPLGPLIYLLTAFGLLLSHGGAEGFGYSQAVAGCLLGVWTYRLGGRRLGHLSAILMCFTVVLVSLNPTSVGEPPPSTSCMPYNRYGFALLALLLVEAVAKVKRAGKANELWGGISTGVILAALLFLKISYFIGGVFLIAALIPCQKQTRARWMGAFGGFGVFFLAFFAFLRFQLVPMWDDFQMVAGAKHLKVNWWIVHNLYPYVIFFGVFIWMAAAFFRARHQVPTACRIAIAGVAVCFAGVFLLSTNFQYFDLPLNAIMAILIVSAVGAEPLASDSLVLKRGAVLLFGTLLAAGSIADDAMGLGFGAYQKYSWDRSAHSSFNAPALAGFTSSERGYVDSVNEGLALVNQYRRPDDTIMSLDFSNPFSYALGLKPAPGGAITLHYGVNFSEAHHPAAERLFGEARLVIIPKQPSEQGLRLGIPLVYGPYLKAHFHLIGESAAWRLYRHNAEPAAGSKVAPSARCFALPRRPAERIRQLHAELLGLRLERTVGRPFEGRTINVGIGGSEQNAQRLIDSYRGLPE